MENFSIFTNFDFFQKFPVKYQIFLYILIVPIMCECGKVKKVLGNQGLFQTLEKFQVLQTSLQN